MLSPLKLKRMMKKRGISMKALSRRMKLSLPTISRYCSGERDPQTVYLYRLATALKCSVANLTYRKLPKKKAAEMSKAAAERREEATNNAN